MPRHGFARQPDDLGMLTVPAHAQRLLAPSVSLSAVRWAWVCFAAGAAWSYAFVFPRAAGLVPMAVLGVGFVFFHVGVLAAGAAVVRGLQRGGLAAFAANGVPVALFWLAVWSVPAFVARFH